MLGGAGLLVLAGCDPFVRSASYRFRMTIEAEQAGRRQSASSVLEVSAQKGSFRLGDTSGSGARVTGEAVALDLADGPVFALLVTARGQALLHETVTRALAPGATDPGSFFAAVRKLGGWSGAASAELPRGDWPMMVRFRDIADPTSVEKVDPDTVGVRRILLETTGEDVTRGIRRRLPWLTDAGLTLDPGGGPTTSPTFAQTIRQRAFSTEIEK